MAETQQILERELAYFTRIKGELLNNHADKFALIKDEVLYIRCGSGVASVSEDVAVRLAGCRTGSAVVKMTSLIR